jgi:hypothetical protein
MPEKNKRIKKTLKSAIAKGLKNLDSLSSKKNFSNFFPTYWESPEILGNIFSLFITTTSRMNKCRMLKKVNGVFLSFNRQRGGIMEATFV